MRKKVAIKVGELYGNWSVISILKDEQKGESCLFRCVECGNEQIFTVRTIKVNKKGICKKCHPENYKNRKKPTAGNPSICIDCVNSCGNCAWSAKRRPVKGWKAEEVKVLHSSGKTITNYRVIECPKYQERE